TSQNVYKGMAGGFNIYNGKERGGGDNKDGGNIRLPSGRAGGRGKTWGDLDYDVELMICVKTGGAPGPRGMGIFRLSAGLDDQMTVNLAYKPYFEVERRKYRFRILNGSVSRFFKIALSDGSPMIQIANDGNLLPHPVVLTRLDEQGIAERYDIVIDFSRYTINQTVWMVNLAEHQDGKKVDKDLRIQAALSGNSQDPCVGKFLEFRIVRDPAQPDISVVPDPLIPNPDLSAIPVARERMFEFNSGANQRTNDPITTFFGPWGIKTDDQG